MKAKLSGEAYDQAGYAKRIANAVAGIVRQQADNGIDVVTATLTTVAPLGANAPGKCGRHHAMTNREHKVLTSPARLNDDPKQDDETNYQYRTQPAGLTLLLACNVLLRFAVRSGPAR